RMPVPPIELNASLPPAVSEIVLTALNKDPAARFQTAGAFLNALRNVQGEVGFGAGTAPAVHQAPQPTGLRLTAVPMPPAPAPTQFTGAQPPFGDSLRAMTAVQGSTSQPPPPAPH